MSQNTQSVTVAPPSLDFGILERTFQTLAEEFVRWRVQSSTIKIPKYQDEFNKLVQHLLQQATVFRTAVDDGVKEAESGVEVSRDIVYFLDRILDNPGLEEVHDLLEDLRVKSRKLADAAGALRDTLETLQKGFLEVSMNKLPRLKKQIEEEGDHTEKKHAIAKDTARGSYLLGAICAGAAAVAISFPPLWITLPHIGAATCAAAAGVIGVSADLYADKEKDLEKRFLETQTALQVLQDMESQVRRALEIVSGHVTYWDNMHTAIVSAETDPEKLLRDNGLPKVGIVRRYRKEWEDIQAQYAQYKTMAREKRLILEIQALQ